MVVARWAFCLALEKKKHFFKYLACLEDTGRLSPLLLLIFFRKLKPSLRTQGSLDAKGQKQCVSGEISLITMQGSWIA